MARKEDPKAYGKLFDSISVCLSKGLGCPVGSVLVGSQEIIDKALRVRKVLGGGMRQSGYLAAAGVYALENHVARLREDHEKAKELGNTLANLSVVKKVEPQETNILIFELDENKISETDFLKKLSEKEISIIGMGQGKLRMVTHLDYTDEMHQHLLAQLVTLFG